VPPTGIFVYHWDRGAGTDNWADAANWYNSTNFFNDQVPVPPADLVFGDKPSGTGPQTVVLNTANTAVRSLWFEAGRDYTLQGTGSFILGGGLADNGRLITVLEGGLPANRYTINLPISLTQESPPKTFEIANYSTDSLLSFLGNVDLKGNSLRITGTGGIYFGGSITGTSTLSTVASSSTQPTTLIVGTASVTFSTTVGSNTLVIRSPHAVSQGTSMITVQSGGSYSMRFSGSGQFRTWQKNFYLSGLGLTRQAGAAPIGALYSEGSISISNVTGGVITLVTDASFGARSGRSDVLSISKRIVGNGSSGFSTVGSGLVVLSASQSGIQPPNQWNGVTAINGGVLRYGQGESMNGSLTWWPGLSGSWIRFNGGILETAAQSAPFFTSFSATLGTAQGGVQWLGDGGFSTTGNSGNVVLNNGAALTWGSGGFVPTGSKLLLSSRYASGEITFTNAINLGSALREVRVERGARIPDSQGNLVENARARMSGALSGTGGGILKTGPGLLWLDSTGNSYTGTTLIREGALRGTIPNLSHIQLEGGVLGLDGNFTRNRFGTGGRIIWQGSGGFGRLRRKPARPNR